MKKVGLLISQLNNGGAERVVSRLTFLLKDEYKIYLILFEDTYMEYNHFGELINLNIKSSSNFYQRIFSNIRRIIKLKKIKKEYNLDIVISFLDSPNFINILSKTKNCKTFVSIRNYSDFEYTFLKRKILFFLIRVLYNLSDKVISVSQVIASFYIDNIGIKKDKLVVIYNPFDIDEIQTLAQEDINPNEENLFNDSFTYVAMGRYMYQKGFWHLVKAFKLVNEKYKNTKLIIIGREYDNGKLRSLIENSGISDKIYLIGLQKNPFKYISKSNCFVMSSLFEGFPNALVESMACKCPVISTDCLSGPREILSNDYSKINQIFDIEKSDYGILVPPFDLEENWDICSISKQDLMLTKAMILMYENQKLTEYYREKAFNRANYFNFEICKEKYMKIIEE